MTELRELLKIAPLELCCCREDNRSSPLTQTDHNMSGKLIVVSGATGQLGGSVARRMLQEGWKVRALTRNHESAAAKALKEGGAELATADYGSVESLQKCFEVKLVVRRTKMEADRMNLERSSRVLRDDHV